MKTLTGVLVTILSTTAFAQMQMGGWSGGDFQTTGGLGNIPRMENFNPDPWNDSNRPTFNDGYTQNPFMPEDVFPNIGGAPGFPTPLDLVTNPNQTNPVDIDQINPDGLSLPDPDWGNEDPINPPPFAFDVITNLAESGLIDLEDLEPFILPNDFRIDQVNTCEELPKLSAFDYVSGLNSVDLTSDRAKQYHWLWAAKRQCAKTTELDVSMEDIRILNSQDPRCVHMSSEDYITDLGLAESDDDAIIIEALYSYLYLCED